MGYRLGQGVADVAAGGVGDLVALVGGEVGELAVGGLADRLGGDLAGEVLVLVGAGDAVEEDVLVVPVRSRRIVSVSAAASNCLTMASTFSSSVMA